VSTLHVPNANKLPWSFQKRERNYLRFYDNKIVAIEASRSCYLKDCVITEMGLHNVSGEELRNVRNAVSRKLFEMWEDCREIND
jgi:hypothetical protein